jgi:DNA replication licensing factor MCM5
LKELCFELQVKYKSIDEVPDFQFLLSNGSNPKSLREINSANVNQLIVTSGIIVSATKPGFKASRMAMQCRNCGHFKTMTVNSGFSRITIPRNCENSVGKVKYDNID